MSSWAALVDRARLAPGETVLVNGATGTSGRLAVQIARHLGANKVIATGRNPETLGSLAAFGADATIALSADDAALEKSFCCAFAEKVDVVIDYLWGRSAELLLSAAAKAVPKSSHIRFVEIGAVTGGQVSLTCCARRRWKSWAAGLAACRVPDSWRRSVLYWRRRSPPACGSRLGPCRSPRSRARGRQPKTRGA
jgi:NADPH:quinone reductase-like Zn-dependent oxidoreductase